MNNNDYRRKISPLYSWLVIIISIIVFWPVGIFLVYKRVKIDKMAGFIIGKIVRCLSYLCFFIVAIGTIVYLVNGFMSEDFKVTLSFLVLGVALYILSKKLISDAEKYKKYISIIINENEYIIDNIAEDMSLPTNVVRKDLNNMINNGYFQGAYINNSTNEIVLPQPNKENINDTTPNYESKIEAKVVTCKCCGAQNKVTTSVGECEYCGSPL
ncbi:hypothetical protein [Clostridium peptidivorans]|uniref:hypothetical protein n=1 Tax=Clostridium peptidivorans TaxID=100174 RepID=UPI000BE4579C|nr:hypothetical protein [Clostridium peptidivorans]